MTDTSVHFNEKRVWRTVHAGLLSCIVLFGGGRLIGIPAVSFWHILVAAAVLLVAASFDKASMRVRIFGLVGALIILTGVVAAAGVDGSLQFLRSYPVWLVGGEVPATGWIIGYELLQTVWLVLVCYVLEVLLEKDFRIKAAGALGLLAALMYALFTEKETAKLCVVLIICCLALTYVEWTQGCWQKEKGRSIQAYMLWLLPFIAVYGILMLFSATPEEPYEWRFVKGVYRQISESVTKLSYRIMNGKGEDYDLTLSGFSGRGEVGSDMQENDREIMCIRDDTGLVTNVYLSGKVYDTFNGRQWAQRNEDAAGERFMDTIETEYAVRRYDEQYFTDYLKYADFRVDYQYFRSEFLFAPLKLMCLRQDGSAMDFRETGGNLFFDKPKGYGTSYEVSFYQLNVGRSEFDLFLEEAGEQGQDEVILDRLLRDMQRRTGEHISTDDLEAYRRNVETYYTEDVELSEEVQEYLDQITAYAWTDVEKLRAIEAELSSFDYTMTPGELPDTITDSAAFLDYFLLESRTGYCSHFATAFTLLARAEGFPARYVQGFCVPMRGGGETKVYSDMAHGWPEVYLEGIGWIPFEPTPGYAGVRYTPWAALSDQSDQTGTSESAQLHRNEPGTRSEDVSVEEETETTVGDKIDVGQIRRFLRSVAILLLSVMGAGAAIYILSRLIGRYRYMRMSVEQRFRTEVYRNLQILSLMGIKREKETLEEFGKRAAYLLAQREVLGFLEDYEGILYGNERVDESVLEDTMRQQRELVLLLKKKRRWRYLYYRFLD